MSSRIRRFRSWRYPLALLAAVALLSGCVSGVSVTITNRSASDLEHVVVSGRGFSEDVGTVAAGGAETLSVRPRGESGVKISFEADGQRYSAENGYIEDDVLYRVLVTVDPDFSITIDTNVR